MSPLQIQVTVASRPKILQNNSKPAKIGRENWRPYSRRFWTKAAEKNNLWKSWFSACNLALFK
jgi:hypothetical protein